MSRDFSAVKAIIFDMDGVLFLSSHCHEVSFRKVLDSMDISNFSYASIAGMRTDDAFRKILAENKREGFSQEQIEEWVRMKRQYAIEFLENEGEVAPGSKKLILELRKQYRIALASSASTATIEIFLRKSGYADVFEFCLDGSIVLKSKPDPAIYSLAAQKLGLKPEECLVVEDAVNGVEAAVSAGIPVIALVPDSRQRSEFAALGPLKIISCLDELSFLFSRQNPVQTV